MISSKTLVVAIASTACLGAAGAGGYLAVRTNAPAQPVEAAPSSVPAPVPAVPDTASSTTVEVLPATEKEKENPGAVTRSEPRENASRETTKTPAGRTEAKPTTPKRSPASAPADTTPPPAPAPIALPPTATTDAAPAPPVPEVAPPVKEPEKPRFEEVIVKTDSVIGIRLDSSISSETAKVEDRVVARVSRDLTVDDRVAIPAGAHLEGNVTLVEKGGKFKERARLGVRFTTLVLADGSTRLPINTETIFRDGDSPTTEASSKIGASAVVGAILGAVVGGKKGAVIGSTAGAAGGTAAVMSGGRNAATLPAGTPLTVKLTAPVTVLVERDPH